MHLFYTLYICFTHIYIYTISCFIENNKKDRNKFEQLNDIIKFIFRIIPNYRMLGCNEKCNYYFFLDWNHYISFFCRNEFF